MNYIIDDELLKIQIASIVGDFVQYAIEQDIINQEVDKIILKSKQPVELVAEGLMLYYNGLRYTVGEISDTELMKRIDKFNGNNIKIYIQNNTNI